MNKNVKWGIGIGFGLALLAFGLFVGIQSLDKSSLRKLPKPPVFRAMIGPARVKPKVVPGAAHLVVLAADGSLWGVGYNDWGQAGGKHAGTMAWTTNFEKFPGGSDWIDAVVLSQATVGLRRDGTLWQWGAVPGGLLVDPTNSPAQIGVASNWVAIASGFQHVLGRQSDGTLWCWGENLNGELGDEIRSPQPKPVLVNSDTDWAAAACVSSINVGLKTNGAVWAWGHFSRTVPSPNPWMEEWKDLGLFKPFQVGTDVGWIRAEPELRGIVAQHRDGSLWRMNFRELEGRTNWTRLPDVPNGVRSWSAGAFGVAAMDMDGRIWLIGQNQFGFLTRRFARSTEAWLPVGEIDSVAVAGTPGIGTGVINWKGELLLWGKRYDDPGGDMVGMWDRTKNYLARYIPQLKPKFAVRMPAYEITPWKALEFVPTNSAAGP